MRRWVAVFAVLWLVGVGAGIVAWAKGSARASRTVEVGRVHRVHLEGIGKLELVEGGSDSLRVEADPAVMRYLRTDVSGGELHIHFDRGLDRVKGSNKWQITFRLTQRDLSRLSDLDLEGVADLQGTGLDAKQLKLSAQGVSHVDLGVHTRALTVTLEGVGECRLHGEATEQNVTVQGVGRYLAKDLRSDTCTISVDGVSQAEVRAEKALGGSVGALSSLSYAGDPKVTVQGEKRVKRMEE